jgi:hypothetical protein
MGITAASEKGSLIDSFVFQPDDFYHRQNAAP